MSLNGRLGKYSGWILALWRVLPFCNGSRNIGSKASFMKLLFYFTIGFLLTQGSQSWGQEVNGRFYPDKEDYRVGEPIFIVLELTNTGSRVIQLDDGHCATRFERIDASPGLSSGAPPGGIGSSCAATIAPWLPGVTVKRRFLLQGPFDLDSPGVYVIRGIHAVVIRPFEGTSEPTINAEITTDFDVSLRAVALTESPAGRSGQGYQSRIPPIAGLHSANSEDKASTLTGKVIRSDSGEAISNAYILLNRENDTTPENHHFDVRTGKQGDYHFGQIPAGKYTVSIYAWFPTLDDVPCQISREARTADDGTVTVEWQRKSEVFMEIATIEHFPLEAGQAQLKEFDLLCR
jgi:hypothetical protein